MSAVCPDEAWEALTWVTIVVESPTRLSNMFHCVDNVVNFLYQVVMNVDAIVRSDEVEFCGE